MERRQVGNDEQFRSKSRTLNLVNTLSVRSSDRHVLIAGGGVIAVCCAYFLAKQGVRVTVVEHAITKTSVPSIPRVADDSPELMPQTRLHGRLHRHGTMPMQERVAQTPAAPRTNNRH